VVASVQGAAAGFGLSLMMACDLVIAADSAFFTLAYINIGTSPDGSGTYFLPRVVGQKKAMEIALLGDRFDAATAKAMGLINFIVPAAELEAETMKLATRLATGPTRAIANTKRLINHSLERSLESQLQAEAMSFADCAASEDWLEGVKAFAEKRRPAFKGR
ncbi:MAG: enoyl-CoA hydratase-related protein, partial [Stellaceae bacterium]